MGEPPPAAPPAASAQQHAEREQNILKSLETLYAKYEGDLDLIFASLREPVPAAFRTDPPLTAQCFARLYYYGREDEADGPGQEEHKAKAR